MLDIPLPGPFGYTLEQIVEIATKEGVSRGIIRMCVEQAHLIGRRDEAEAQLRRIEAPMGLRRQAG